MIRNYILIAWRNLLKNKVFSLINVLGLAIGMAACLLIIQYVTFELSYDTFHTKGSDIYRVSMQHTSSDGHKNHYAANYAATGKALKENFPEVKDFVRFCIYGGKTLLTKENEAYQETGVVFADASLLTLFSYPLLKGNAATALAEPNTVVLTESVARKYFGTQDPIGQTIRFKEGTTDVPLRVTGVLQDIPRNSHLQFSIVASFKTFSQEISKDVDQDWGWNAFYTYVLVSPQTNPHRLAAKFSQLLEKQKGGYFKSAGVHEDFFLQPMQDIHLHYNLLGEPFINGDAKLIYSLLIIAFFIVVIAWINYINLATAKAMERAKEVGVRKVTGANRLQLVRQFLLESLLLNLISLAIAVTIVQISLPAFHSLIGKTISSVIWANPAIWIALVGLFMMSTLGAGLYPAFVLSSFQPIIVLKGKFVNSKQGAFLRKGLVVVQFAASIALIIGTATVYQQIQFMRNADLGINLEQALVIEAPIAADPDSIYRQKVKVFREQVENSPAVQSVTSSNFVPGQQGSGIGGWGGYIRRVESQPTEVKSYRITGIDYDFIPTLQLKLVAGRNFSPDFSTDWESVILTEEAVRQLGFKTPQTAIGQKIYYPINSEQNNKPIQVVGVVRDFHYQSMKMALDPIIFHLSLTNRGFFTAKVNTANVSQTLALMKKSYEATFPGNPFEYFFLDDFFNNQYKADLQFGKVFGLFASLAIFIACLGLYGLATFTITQRTKEIGVRKVLGASINQILLMLSKDFVRLVIVANLLAWPVAYLVMQEWLKDYASKIDISIGLFLVPGLLVLAIALLTISIQTIRTARANPVKALRYE